jgi:hypothetical protein
MSIYFLHRTTFYLFISLFCFILLLFVYGLFHSAVRSSNNIVPIIGLSVNNELDRMWKKVVMALFEVLPQNLQGSSSLALQCSCCKACSEPVHVTASSFQMEMSCPSQYTHPY